MKLSVAFFALATIGHVHGHGLRVLQDCPTPGGGGTCQLNIDPVVCGEFNCEYDNECIANQAGFVVENDCTTKVNSECPPPGEGMCTMQYEPVVCGTNNCEYSNGCNAGLAGFNADTDCTLAEQEPQPQVEEPQCPPLGEGMCTMEYMPVVCGTNNCEYSNGCNAGLAGFNPDTDCTLVEQEAQPQVEEPQCPPPGEGMCTMEYMPVVCGTNNCEYSNGCNAGLAGFNPDTDCTLVEQEAQPQAEECPTPGAGVCTDDYNPVVCGELACEYPNACNADLAGFATDTECVPMVPMATALECPTPRSGICTADNNPVKCGDNNCEYPNPCTANLAGFAETTQCTPVDNCPVPGTGGACTADLQKVICNGCEYDNECLANLAGFVASQCTTPPPPCNPTTSADCPPPPPEGGPNPPPACNPTTDANCPPPPATTTAETAAPLESGTDDSGSAATSFGMAASLVAAAVALFMA